MIDSLGLIEGSFCQECLPGLGLFCWFFGLSETDDDESYDDNYWKDSDDNSKSKLFLSLVRINDKLDLEFEFGITIKCCDSDILGLDIFWPQSFDQDLELAIKLDFGDIVGININK